MPKRVAETDPFKQFEDSTGSGPFIFVKNEWKPGERTVYVKNPKYKPRPEPASALAGGKVAKVDRVEWVAMSDQQTATSALIKGEIDMIESPQHDLFKVMEADKNVKLVNLNKWGNQYVFRFNQLFKPFDNPKIRQAALYAFNQKDFLDGVIGDAKWYKTCKAMFMCDTPLASFKGFEDKFDSELQQGPRAPEGGRLRRHARRAHALDRPLRARQPGAGRQGAAGEGRHEGRHAVDGLADPGQPPRPQGPAGQGRLERLLDLLGRARHRRSAGQRLHQRRRAMVPGSAGPRTTS